MWSSSKQLHLWYTILPAVEYILSDGTDMAGIARYFCATFEIAGKWEAFSFHYCRGSVLLSVWAVCKYAANSLTESLVVSAFSLAIFLQEPASKKSIPGAGLDFFATGPSSTITGVICFISSLMASKGAALLSWSSVPVSASSVQNLRFRSEVVFLNDTIDGKMLYRTIALTDFNLRLFFMYRHVCDAD